MDRRSFLKAAAAAPAIVAIPAVAENPAAKISPDILAQAQWRHKVITKVSEHGRVLKESGEIPMGARHAAYAEWRREMQEMGERLGLEIVEERSHYFPAGIPDKVDPLGQWACFAANFTLGHVS